jgi:hypothetical protein
VKTDHASRKVGSRVILGQFIATMLISMWVMGLQRPPVAAVALHILLPWIAVGMAATSPSVFTLSLDSGDARRPLSAMWAIHAIALVMLFRCVKYYVWTRVITEACVVGLVLILIVILVDGVQTSFNNLTGLAFLMLLCAGYGYGVVTELNVLLDHSADTVVESTISGKVRQKAFSVQVQPWGPVQNTRNVTVPAGVYEGVRMGGAVCMVQRSGALGVGWYTAQVCPWHGGKVSLGSEDILSSLTGLGTSTP